MTEQIERAVSRLERYPNNTWAVYELCKAMVQYENRIADEPEETLQQLVMAYVPHIDPRVAQAGVAEFINSEWNKIYATGE